MFKTSLLEWILSSKTKENPKTVVSKSTYTYDKELRDAALHTVASQFVLSNVLPFFQVSGVDAVAGGRPLLVGAFPLLPPPPSMSGHWLIANDARYSYFSTQETHKDKFTLIRPSPPPPPQDLLYGLHIRHAFLLIYWRYK